MKALFFTITLILVTSLTFAQSKETKRNKICNVLSELPTKKLAVIILRSGDLVNTDPTLDSVQSQIEEEMKVYPYSYEFVNFRDYLMNKDQDKYPYALIGEKVFYIHNSRYGGNTCFAIFNLYLIDTQRIFRYQKKSWYGGIIQSNAYKKFVKTINRFNKKRKVNISSWKIRVV
jgi:hypothetical protein